ISRTVTLRSSARWAATEAPAIPAPMTRTSLSCAISCARIRWLCNCPSRMPSCGSLSRGSPMPDVQLNFSRVEYDARIARTRSAMEKAGVEVMLISDPSNMAWLTGYDGWSFYVHQAVLLALDGEPWWWGRGMDALGAKRTVFMREENITGYPDHFVQSTERHPMQHLAREIAARGWAKARIGVELDNYWYSAAAHAVLTRELPNASLIDATGLVNWQRVVKSEAEIDFIRRAARVVDAMHARVAELIEP